MPKFYQSLELLNYNLKKNFKHSPIKIIENEKYSVCKCNDMKNLNKENSVFYVPSDTHENVNCENAITETCGNLDCASRNKTVGKIFSPKELKNVGYRSADKSFKTSSDYIPTSRNTSKFRKSLRNWIKKEEAGLKSPKIRMSCPPKSIIESKTSFKNYSTNDKYRSAHKDSDAIVDYFQKNVTRCLKSTRDLSMNNEDLWIHNDCKINLYNSSSNTEISELKSSKSKVDCAPKCIAEIKTSLQTCSKKYENGSVDRDSEMVEDYFSRNTTTECNNSFQINDDKSIHTDCKTNLSHLSNSATEVKESHLKQYRNSEDLFAYEDSEITFESPEKNRKLKRTTFSSLWNISGKNFKHLHYKKPPKTKNISLVDKIKIVENPKYLPDYTPSEREIAEENLFQSGLQSFLSSSEKIHKDLVTCQDKVWKCFLDIKSICWDIEDTKEMLSDLENVLWINGEFDLQEIASDAKEDKNISVGKEDINYANEN